MIRKPSESASLAGSSPIKRTSSDMSSNSVANNSGLDVVSTLKSNNNTNMESTELIIRNEDEKISFRERMKALTESKLEEEEDFRIDSDFEIETEEKGMFDDIGPESSKEASAATETEEELEYKEKIYEYRHSFNPPLPVGFLCYFTIGYDAIITNDFAVDRQMNPSKYSSQFGNQLQYVKYGFKDLLKPTDCAVAKYVDLYINKDYENKIHIPPEMRSLKLININSAANGMFFWGSGKSGTDELREWEHPRCDDGKIEVCASLGVQQIVKSRLSLGHAHRIAQVSDIRFVFKRAPFAIQIDGEGFIIQEKCTIDVSLYNHKVPMLIGYKSPKGVPFQYMQESYTNYVKHQRHLYRKYKRKEFNVHKKPNLKLKTTYKIETKTNIVQRPRFSPMPKNTTQNNNIRNSNINANINGINDDISDTIQTTKPKPNSNEKDISNKQDSSNASNMSEMEETKGEGKENSTKEKIEEKDDSNMIVYEENFEDDMKFGGLSSKETTPTEAESKHKKEVSIVDTLIIGPPTLGKKKSVALDYIDELENDQKSEDSVGKDDCNIPEFAGFAKSPYWEQIRKANRLHPIDDSTAHEMREELMELKTNGRYIHKAGATSVLPGRSGAGIGTRAGEIRMAFTERDANRFALLGNTPPRLVPRQTVD